MAFAKRKEVIARPSATGPRTPDSFNAMAAVVVGIDQAFRDSEQRWGCGRLVCLVSDATRAAFHRGMTAYQTAITAGDVDAVQAVAPKMRAALAYMDAEALAAGCEPLAPVVWETLLEDGTVLAIVRTGAEASAVAASGRKVSIWSLEEVGRVLARVDMANVVKLEFPGATVTRVTQRDEGFAEDWVAGTGDEQVGWA